RDMSLFSMEKSANLVLQQRWQNVEGWIADSWRVHRRATLDLGLRFSHLPNPTAVGDTMTSFDPTTFDPALGNDPCNGLLEVPGTHPCRDAGHRGGTPGPGRTLVNEPGLLVAPRVGIACA